MTQKPLFTVVIVAHTTGDAIRSALDSVLAQREEEWEAVVAHPASAAGALATLASYAARDARIRLLAVDDVSPSVALNEAAKAARGAWLCFLTEGVVLAPEALSRYRDAVAAQPECRLFAGRASHGSVHGPAGTTRRPFPDERWQLLEMLRTGFIHPGSACLASDALAAVGAFDSACAAPLYDMWLRLLQKYPAMEVAAPTCIVRYVSGAAIDAAELTAAADGLLDRSKFAALVPFVDLKNPWAALTAFRRVWQLGEAPCATCDDAARIKAVVRALEWAWSEAPALVGVVSRRWARRRARRLATKFSGSSLGFFWKAVSVAAAVPQQNFAYDPTIHCGFIPQGAGADVHAEASPGEGKKNGREIILLNQIGMRLTPGKIYGTQRAALERAKYLIRRGSRVAIIAVTDTGLSSCEGVPVIGVRNDDDVLEALSNWGRADAVIGISRKDFLREVRADRAVVYHHNSGLDLSLAGEAAAVVCVSEFSSRNLVTMGASADNIHVVRNGADVPPRPELARHERSLLFAGHIVDYKGFDIALEAFRILKTEFPDALFDAYGGYFERNGRPASWKRDVPNSFSPGWLDEQGLPVWSRIEAGLSGFHYHGQVTQRELTNAYATHSLLVMPSLADEPCPLVSLEAQAAGCIPVFPRKAGFPETIVEGITGFLYDSNTPEALASAVAALWNDGLPNSEQRQQARVWVTTSLTWDRTGRQFADVLDSAAVLDASRRKSEWRAAVVRTYSRWIRHTRPIRRSLGITGDTVSLISGAVRRLRQNQSMRRS